jgi:hypothetical protein
MDVSTAVVRVRGGMDRTDALGQDCIVERAPRRSTFHPRVIATGGHTERAAGNAHRNRGLIRIHEFEEREGPTFSDRRIVAALL